MADVAGAKSRSSSRHLYIVSCGGSKTIYCNGQGCYTYYDASSSGSGCLTDGETDDIYIDEYLDLLQFDVDSQDGSLYYY
ncbi:hypothetical protein BRD00_08015 [Halobacteriales archaeon QS_8_69_26]|nr:MAG: hypothetical protein BRD00_08015 [Halobacteriales archaeon QS_8_69_26]